MSSLSFTNCAPLQVEQGLTSLQVVQQISSTKSYLHIRQEEKPFKLMVISTITQLWGQQQVLSLIPIVLSVIWSGWCNHTFKFFDPGGQQKLFLALFTKKYAQGCDVLTSRYFLGSTK